MVPRDYSSSITRVSTNVGVEGGQDLQTVPEAGTAQRVSRAPPIPASVKINVEGAFIVDDETVGKNGEGSEYVHYEHKDIRLPHHTDVVSHIAVDVCANSLTTHIY